MAKLEIAEEVKVVDSGDGFVHDTGHLISKRRGKSLPQWATAWIVLIPAMIFLLLFMFYPILNTFFMAFIQNFSWQKGAGSFAFGNFFAGLQNFCQQWEINDDGVKYCFIYNEVPRFGFENFATVLGNQVFLHSIWNTFELVIIEVPLTIMIALLIATFLNGIKALRGLYQTIFFLPYVTNTIALGLVFQIIFSSGEGGIMNMLITALGGQPVNWLRSTEYHLNEQVTLPPATRFHQGVVIVTYAIWNGLAFKILVFMSGLATIDKQYYDAAKIDGSSNFTIWRRITLPLLSPQILYITITSFIGAFKMYTGVMSVYSSVATTAKNSYYFGGDVGTEWMPIVGWIYKELDSPTAGPGVAAAGSLILLAIILAITAVQYGVSSKRVHY